jgi:hypothetical protein
MGKIKLQGGVHSSALLFSIVLALILPGLLFAVEAAQPDKSSRRVISFAGRDWWVKNEFWGPGPNHFSDSEESVWVDADGKLHLKIRQINGVWNCAEVWTLAPAGYGNYLFWLESRVDLYDQNVVAAPFLYADDLREIDIEFSRWGDPGYPCGSYTVQPYYTAGNHHPFPVELNGSWTSHSFLWQPDYVYFRSLHDHFFEPPQPYYVIEEWTYTGADIPAESADMLLHINRWLLGGMAPTNGQEAELVVSNVFVTPGIFIEPPDLQISRTDTGQLHLSWNAVPNALSYVVCQADSPLPLSDPGWTELPTTEHTWLELDATAVRKFYHVKAVRE